MTGSVEVRPLDAWDDAEMDAAYDVWRRGELHDRPHAVVDSRNDLRGVLVRPSATQATTAWVATRGGVVAGLVTAGWPLVGEVSHCWPTLVVAPEHRRAGVGTAMWHVLERAVGLAGRHVVQVEVGRPVAVEPWPGAEFARRLGFTLALREEHHLLRRADPSGLPAAEHPEGYAVRTWQARCPEEFVSEYCRLRERFVAEAPTGDLVLAEQVWDTARVRASEQARADLGRSSWTSVAVTPDRQLVGFTELMGPSGAAAAYQHQTLVLPGHRGHRLGLAMKAANLRAMLADEPDRTEIHTWVAPDNEHMRAVNAAFGFEPVELLDEWQRDLGVTFVTRTVEALDPEDDASS